MSVVCHLAYLMMASRAKTFEQQPPKIRATMLSGPSAGIMIGVDVIEKKLLLSMTVEGI